MKGYFYPHVRFSRPLRASAKFASRSSPSDTRESSLQKASRERERERRAIRDDQIANCRPAAKTKLFTDAQRQQDRQDEVRV